MSLPTGPPPSAPGEREPLRSSLSRTTSYMAGGGADVASQSKRASTAAGRTLSRTVSFAKPTNLPSTARMLAVSAVALGLEMLCT